MGKIRVNTIGSEEEQKQKEEAKKRRESKKVGKTEELNELKETEESNIKNVVENPLEIRENQKVEKKKIQKKKTKAKTRSSRYSNSVKLRDKNKLYALSEAIDVLSQMKKTKFDETVELHINTIEKGVSGQVTLPHGTGKQTRVVIVAPSKDPKAADEILKKIEAGKIDFDVLIATPDAMPKLAKVARVLGPRGLMPNPKNGTVTAKPEELAKKYQGGQVNFKTEAKANVIHLSVGKMSFGKEKLSENISTLLDAVEKTKVKNVFLKSTMSPSLKLIVS